MTHPTTTGQPLGTHSGHDYILTTNSSKLLSAFLYIDYSVLKVPAACVNHFIAEDCSFAAFDFGPEPLLGYQPSCNGDSSAAFYLAKAQLLQSRDR